MTVHKKAPRATSGPILMVPLDDRPVNVQLPAQLAAVAGRSVLMPPRRLLGRFRRPGNPEAILKWMARHLPGASAVLVSLDMIAHGGLVASRSAGHSRARAVKRLQGLERLLASHPEIPARATSVILRQSTTVTSTASLDVWRALFEITGLPTRIRGARFAQVRATGGPLCRALAEHLACRVRNHGVNQAAVRLVADGRLQSLVLLKEDCSPHGLHREEERALLNDVSGRGVGDRVDLQPGTDEGLCLMLGRQLLEDTGSPGRLAVEYRPHRLARAVPLYEDRAVARTVRSQARACGFRPGVRRPDAVLTVTGTPPLDGDCFCDPPRAQGARRPGARSGGTTEDALQAPPGAGWWGLADVGRANGADVDRARDWLASGLAVRASAFAAWNTAANTTGTVLAHLAALIAGQRRAGAVGVASRAAMARAQRVALLTRWADDLVFQSILRPGLIAHARRHGIDPFAAGGRAGELDGWLAARFPRIARRELAALLAAPVFTPGGVLEPEKKIRLEARLPWGRVFEAEVQSAPGDSRDSVRS